MKKDVQPVNNGIVTRSNKLIEARYKLSLHEQKVIYSIISLIQPSEREFYTYRFKISELAKFCGIPANNANRDLEEVTRNLRSRVLTLKDGRRTLQTGWINSALYEAGTVEFELDHKLMPYLLGLKDVFTSIRVSELMSFKSQYSGRIYELLYQQKAFGSRRFTLEEFKELLGLDKKAYPLFGHIKARIIEPAVKDINKNTPLDVTYETEKTGLKVTAIIFRMKSKPPKEGDCLGSDMFDEAAQEEIKAAAAQQAAAATPGADELIKAFAAHKIPEADVLGYLSQHPINYCWAQLKHLEKELSKVSSGERKPIANPKRWMVGCMEKNYAKYVAPVPKGICPKCGGEGFIKQFFDDGRSLVTKCDCHAHL